MQRVYATSLACGVAYMGPTYAGEEFCIHLLHKIHFAPVTFSNKGPCQLVVSLYLLPKDFRLLNNVYINCANSIEGEHDCQL